MAHEHASIETHRRPYEMNDAKDLDSLIAAHDRYLDTILQKGLLGPKSQLLTHTLSTLFEVILRFRGFADRLYEARGGGYIRTSHTFKRIHSSVACCVVHQQ